MKYIIISYIITFLFIIIISYIRYLNNKKDRNKLIDLMKEANELKPMIYSILASTVTANENTGNKNVIAVRDLDDKIISFVINISGTHLTLPNPYSILFPLYCIEGYLEVLGDSKFGSMYISRNDDKMCTMYVVTINKMYKILSERNSLSNKNYKRFHDMYTF